MRHRASRERDAYLMEAVRKEKSIAGVLRALQMRVGGGNYGTVKRAIAELQLNTSHWTGKGHRKGSRDPVVKARPLCEVLVRGVPFNSNALRLRLLREGIFVAECADCHLTQWRGRGIPLELDHRDGVRDNNELTNLRLLCPNCHAMTPTYRGRNRQAKRTLQATSPGGGIGFT